MSVLVVIPARYASTRFPGKPLQMLTGASGTKQSLVERTWRVAQSVKGVDRVVIATDDERIRDAAQAFGAEVVMTSTKCANGTERCAEVVRKLDTDYKIIVNLQGDAPLTPPGFLEKLIDALVSAPEAQVATPVLRCDSASLNSFLEDRRNGRVGGTTVVFDNKHRALYFSKEVIPFTNRVYEENEETPVFHHVGVYAYRPNALVSYKAMNETQLEKLEGLEQLRFLVSGETVLCVEMDHPGHPFWELNNPEDVERIEAILLANRIE